MFGIGTTEMIVIGIVGILLFGKRLPEAARGVGSAFREFKKGLTEVTDEIDDGKQKLKEVTKI